MKQSAKRTFLHMLELLAIALSFLGRNSIARFLAAKFGLSVVVEVTSRFGADTGHRLSSFIALLIAEPRLIAVLVTAVIVLVHSLVWIISKLKQSRHRPRGRRPLEQHPDREDPVYPGNLPSRGKK